MHTTKAPRAIAQDLPLPILERVMEHVSGRKLCLYSAAPSNSTDKGSTTHLLHAMGVCQSWRYVASLFYYREGLFSTRDAELDIDGTGSALDLHHIVAAGFRHDIRVMHLGVTMEDMLCGRAAERLLSIGRLASVRRIRINLKSGWLHCYSHCYAAESCIDKDRERLDQFCSILRQLLPGLQAIELDFSSMYYDDTYKIQCAYLYTKLLKGNTKLLSLCDTPSHTLGLENTASASSTSSGCVGTSALGIVRLSIQVEVWTEHHIEIVRQNAASLQVLRLVQIPLAMCLQLVKDPKNRNAPVIYPCLQTLETQLANFASPSSALVDASVNVFPELESVICHNSCAFASRLLLGYNCSRLKRLQMFIPERFVTDCDMLCTQTYPQLTHIDLNVESDLGWIKQGAAALRLFSKIFSLSKSAQSIKMSTFIGGSIDFLPEMACCNSLRRLSMPKVHFTLPTAVRLIESFRWLSYAEIALDCGSNCRQIPTDDAISQWHSQTAGGLAEHLLSLEFGDARYPTIRCSAEYIVLLASLLPSLRHATVCSQDIEWVQSVNAAISGTLTRKAYNSREGLNARLQSVFSLK